MGESLASLVDNLKSEKLPQTENHARCYVAGIQEEEEDTDVDANFQANVFEQPELTGGELERASDLLGLLRRKGVCV